jgi:Flp pilus assembly pilin Flp
MKSFITTFCTNENGAVAVDWVVLTALVVGLIAAAFSGVEGGVSNLSASLLAYLQGLAPGA